MRDGLLMIYPWIKSVHLIMVIAWMAGMMYLPRLFIYHHKAGIGSQASGYFLMMQRRLLKGIINPSMILVWILGLTLIFANPELLKSGWLHVKIGTVFAISGVHGVYANAHKKFEAGILPRTEKFWRIINEVPFVLMIICVIMVIVRPF